MDRPVLTPEQLRDGAAGLDPGWRASAESLTRTIEFPTFLAAVEFVQRLAPAAERLDHHPDLSLSWRTVTLTLSTHSSGGVTELDLQLAGELDEIAAGLAAGYTVGDAGR